MEAFHSAHNDFRSGPGESYEEQRQNILESLEGFSGAPFTVQRLAELVLMSPGEKGAYRSGTKYFAALDKVVTVTSTLPVTVPGEEARAVIEDQQAISRNLDHVDKQPVPPLLGSVPRDTEDLLE